MGLGSAGRGAEPRTRCGGGGAGEWGRGAAQPPLQRDGDAVPPGVGAGYGAVVSNRSAIFVSSTVAVVEYCRLFLFHNSFFLFHVSKENCIYNIYNTNNNNNNNNTQISAIALHL